MWLTLWLSRCLQTSECAVDKEDVSGAAWLTRNGRLPSSLVPMPYPLMTKTSRVDKAKILGLASTFLTNVALETCITKCNIVAQKIMHNNVLKEWWNTRVKMDFFFAVREVHIVKILIIYNMQKQGKGQLLLSHHWCQCLPRYVDKGEGPPTERMYFTRILCKHQVFHFTNIWNSNAWTDTRKGPKLVLLVENPSPLLST